MLDQGPQVPLGYLHLPQDLRELHCSPERGDGISDMGGLKVRGRVRVRGVWREVRTKEAQKVVRPVQVGGGRELVLQRVVVWSELPAQHLRKTTEVSVSFSSRGVI